MEIMTPVSFLLSANAPVYRAVQGRWLEGEVDKPHRYPSQASSQDVLWFGGQIPGVIGTILSPWAELARDTGTVWKRMSEVGESWLP